MEGTAVKRWRAWFLPRNDDVLATLVDQLEAVEQALTVLAAWSAGASTKTAVLELRRLSTLEHQHRRRLNTQVRTSFSTPLEAEDLFEFGERLGAIAESSYTLVREAEMSHTAPDRCLRTIVEAVVEAAGPLAASVRALPHRQAARLADESLVRLILAEHRYREAIADLENENDLRRELRRRELYRRGEHLTSATQRMARRVWYAVYKTE